MPKTTFGKQGLTQIKASQSFFCNTLIQKNIVMGISNNFLNFY